MHTHLRVEDGVLEIACLSVEVCVQERALCDLLGVGADDAVLYCPHAAKHPHQVIEVIRGHSLVQAHSKLRGTGESQGGKGVGGRGTELNTDRHTHACTRTHTHTHNTHRSVFILPEVNLLLPPPSQHL